MFAEGKALGASYATQALHPHKQEQLFSAVTLVEQRKEKTDFTVNPRRVGVYQILIQSQMSPKQLGLLRKQKGTSASTAPQCKKLNDRHLNQMPAVLAELLSPRLLLGLDT